MNGVLLAGFTDQEAAAIEIMLGMNWADWRCLTLRRGFTLGVPDQTSAAKACSLCIVDLFGFGMRKYSQDNETRLLEFLNDRSAVLMVWGQGGGWLERELVVAEGQMLQWVTMPYTSAGMRDAVRKLLTGTDLGSGRRTTQRTQSKDIGKSGSNIAQLRSDSSASSGPSAIPEPAWKRAMAMADEIKAQTKVRRAEPRTTALLPKEATAPQIKSELMPKRADSLDRVKREASDAAPTPVPRAEPKSILDEGLQGLSRGAFDVLLTVFPTLRDVPIMRAAYRIAGTEGVIGLRVGDNPVATLHMRQGWIRSGLPQSALFKMLHTPHLVESVMMDPLADEVAQVDMRHAGSTARVERSLDAVSWDVISEGIKAVPLEAKADMVIQLRRFPNFTITSEVSSLDVQLSAICSRSSQRLADLLRAFPDRKLEVLRFVILSVVSGAAHVRGMENPRAPTPTTSTIVPASRPPSVAKRGLFKSLLSKLLN